MPNGPTEGASASITRESTGFSVDVRVRDGRFLVQGLEPGGPYVVTVRQIGYAPVRLSPIDLAVGELAEVRIELRPLATTLEDVRIVSAEGSLSSQAGGGAAVLISDDALHRIPTLDRGLYDFVRLIPFVTTRIGIAGAGMSAGGVGFRFNDFRINGVSERTLSGGVSNAFAGAKSVPLDAVREYQVLLAPYDVRYGDFSGALVNAVTRTGTNDVRGSVFAYGRNDRLTRDASAAGVEAYEQLQYGASVGGPIVADRAHFFVAAERQHLITRAPGPYAGQPADAERPVPIADGDLTRLEQSLASYGLSAGSAARVDNGNPQVNALGRLDLTLPAWNSRLVAWHNAAASETDAFSRSASGDFPLSTYQLRQSTSTRTTALQLHSALGRAGGGHNELLISHLAQQLLPDDRVHQPIVRVSVPAMEGGRVTVTSGTHELAQSSSFRTSAVTIRDALTLPLGTSHLLTIGAEAERFRIRRGGVPGSFGIWTFAGIDDLDAGVADRYEVGVDVGVAGIPLRGTQYGAFVGDRWDARPGLALTIGVRADLLAIEGTPPYQSGVDSLFGRRTDRLPRRRVEVSPRAGFEWAFGGARLQRVRGGVGLFTGRYPLAWAHTAFVSHGTGGGLLRCGRSPQDVGPAPAFDPDPLSAPLACASGPPATATRRGDVDLLAEDLRMMRTVRASLAWERPWAWRTRLTIEGMATRALSDAAFVNLNLGDPVGLDRNDRVMYGTMGQSGVGVPALRTGFSEVIEIRNTSAARSVQVAATLTRDFSQRLAGSVAYGFTRARDAQTPLRVNTRGSVAWASARVVSGRHDDLTPGISGNDVPHRLVIAGIYRMPRRRWSTEMAFSWIGESGRPFTYLSAGTLRLGDLNADGSNANDPIYVPRDVYDRDEIALDGSPAELAAQQAALDHRIRTTRCLRRQRGRILERNSCREPWSNTTMIAVRQSLPIGSRTVEAELDLFNPIGLLRQQWGARRVASASLLQHVGSTTDSFGRTQGLFRFDHSAPQWIAVPDESAVQLQIALRYHF